MAAGHQDTVILDSCPAFLHRPGLLVHCQMLTTAADTGAGRAAALLLSRGQVSLQEPPLTVVYLSVLVKITGVWGSEWKLSLKGHSHLTSAFQQGPPHISHTCLGKAVCSL